MASFEYHRHARNPGTVLIVAAVWIALFLAWRLLDAAPWLVLPIAAFTLPAVVDLILDTRSGLVLNDEALEWYAGRRRARVVLEEIDHIRLDTRLDFSVRASAVLATGRRVHLPFESTPPHRAFETALAARGIRVQRHHFQLRQ